MLDGVVRISSAGDLIGSGCLIAVASETIPGHHWSYVVTAHHVVDKQVPIEVQAPDADYRDKPNPDSYWSLHPAVEVSDWRQPLDGVDLAIAPFFGRPGEADAVLAFRLEDQVLEDRYGPDLAGPIYYTGMFSPERGVEVPMARTGTVGVMNVPDLRSDYEGFTHLVDCRSYEGFSGSPCFTQRVFAEGDRVLDPPPVAPSEARRDDGSVPEYAGAAGLG